MTVAAGPQRPIPTVPVSPALLREGDIVLIGPWPNRRRKARVAAKPERTRDGDGWRVPLDGASVLVVPAGGKVRTQRRPNPGPATPDAAWDAAMDSYPRPRYG